MAERTFEEMKAGAATLPSKRRTSNIVYFILATETKRVKIGMAADPIERLNSLQTGCPEALELVAFIQSDTAKRFEGDLHAKFRRHHVRGEWYAMDHEVSHYIHWHACRDWELLDRLTGRQTPTKPKLISMSPVVAPGVPLSKLVGRRAALARYKLARGIA